MKKWVSATWAAVQQGQPVQDQAGAAGSARVTRGVDRDRRAAEGDGAAGVLAVRAPPWAARLEKWKASADSRWIRSWLRLAPARTITSVTAQVR